MLANILNEMEWHLSISFSLSNLHHGHGAWNFHSYSSRIHSFSHLPQAGISSTDTNDPFYVGGVPDGASFSALRTTDKFVGCVRNFRFENRTQPLNAGDVFGDVNVGSCPTN